MSLTSRWTAWVEGNRRAKGHRSESRTYNKELRRQRDRVRTNSREHPTQEQLADEIAWRAEHGFVATEAAARAARKHRRGARNRHSGVWMTPEEDERYEFLFARCSARPVDVRDVVSEADLDDHFAGDWFDWQGDGTWRYAFTHHEDQYLRRLQAAATGAVPVEVVRVAHPWRYLSNRAETIRGQAEQLQGELGIPWLGAYPDARENRVRIELRWLTPELEAAILKRFGAVAIVREAPSYH